MPHQHVGIPQQHPLVPACRGHPASDAKETPVDTGDELCVPIHDAHLLTDARAARSRDDRALRGAVVPQAHRHVVAGADEDVAGVGAPGDLADGVLVALHEGLGPAVGAANVKGADDAVDAGGRDHGVVVLVPVVREELGGGGAAAHAAAGWRRVHRHRGHEVVLGGRGRAQVKEAQVGVGGDGGYQGRVGGAEGGAVCAVANWQRLDGKVACWRPLLGGKTVSEQAYGRGLGKGQSLEYNGRIQF